MPATRAAWSSGISSPATFARAGSGLGAPTSAKCDEGCAAATAAICEADAAGDEHERVVGDLLERAVLVHRSEDRCDVDTAHDADADTRRRLRSALRLGDRGLHDVRRATAREHRGQSQEKRTGRAFGPPRKSTHRDADYLTADGMPLTLPAFSSVYCLATAERIDTGTLLLHLP